MLGHPPHRHHPPHPPHHHQHRHPEASEIAPIFTDHEFQILRDLLANDDEAKALFQIMQNASPDVAALGFLMLRVFERTRSS